MWKKPVGRQMCQQRRKDKMESWKYYGMFRHLLRMDHRGLRKKLCGIYLQVEKCLNGRKRIRWSHGII